MKATFAAKSSGAQSCASCAAGVTLLIYFLSERSKSPGVTVPATIFAGSELLFPKLLSGFSFGFVTEAVFVNTPLRIHIFAVRVIVGKSVPTATVALLVQVNPEAPSNPTRVQFHPVPVGTPAGRINPPNEVSDTVVVPDTMAVPLFRTTKVYVA